ncbi:MAG: hypothetical protein AABX17_00900 [Nanoarchaeota archaeon]
MEISPWDNSGGLTKMELQKILIEEVRNWHPLITKLFDEIIGGKHETET